MAATGKQLKQSMKVLHNLILYLRLPAKKHRNHLIRRENVGPKRTFVIKAVHSADTRAFMVPSQDEEVVRVFDLICKEQTDCLKRLFTSVYVVAKEKIICFRREAAAVKESE
jgi:hypothetical protein